MWLYITESLWPTRFCRKNKWCNQIKYRVSYKLVVTSSYLLWKMRPNWGKTGSTTEMGPSVPSFNVNIWDSASSISRIVQGKIHVCSMNGVGNFTLFSGNKAIICPSTNNNNYTIRKKVQKCHLDRTLSKATNKYHLGTNMHPLGGNKVQRCTCWKCTAPVTAFVFVFLRV